MSLFQLGLGGGGPIGAFIAGTICSVWGLKAAMLLPALAMLLLIAVVADPLAPAGRCGRSSSGYSAAARTAEAERLPDVLQRRDQPGHVVVANAAASA